MNGAAYLNEETVFEEVADGHGTVLGLWGIRRRSAAAIATAVLLVFAAVVGVSARLSRPTAAGVLGHESTGLVQIVSQKATPLCTEPWHNVLAGKISPGQGNCVLTKCCTITGYSCFQKSAGAAGCLEKCDPKEFGKVNGKLDHWDCTMPHSIVPLVEVKAQTNATLYCFTAYTANTGTTKKSHELELLQKQFSMGVGIFSCPFHDVFSDVSAEVGPGLSTIRVADMDGDFHSIKRRKVGSWVNTGMFKQIWKAVGVKKTWEQATWVVKVDADAVFLPSRLVKILNTQLESYSGVYIENCVGVQYGYFGSLEVMSHKAFETLFNSIDWCQKHIHWAQDDATKWGPIGEDLFAQMCMDLKGVSKVQNFGVTTDGACPGVRKIFGQEHNEHWQPDCAATKTPVMHPFKKVDEWVSCLAATSRLGD